MRFHAVLLALIVTFSAVASVGQSQRRPRLNPVIELLEQGKPVFGLYAPAKGTPIELAKLSLANRQMDFLFNGSMERGLTQLPAFAEFVKAMADLGALAGARLTHPMMLKVPKISTDPSTASENISRLLNLGISGTVFVQVESAEEVRQGLAAMRFKSKGGTRPDDAGLWPLDSNGELVNFSIVESKEGLARVREIAAVQGIGVLFPGAGTLRSVFRNDPEGWDKAIQQVLSACKEFKVACGYPANNPQEMEQRMKQGFSVFISSWSDDGFKAVAAGRQAAGRPQFNP